MAGTGPLTQEMEPVVIRKKAPNAAGKKDEKPVNAARSGKKIHLRKNVRKMLKHKDSDGEKGCALEEL